MVRTGCPALTVDSWILIADEAHASLLVQSSVGSLHEIESWDCSEAGVRPPLAFAEDIARCIESLQADFDSLASASQGLPAVRLEEFQLPRRSFPNEHANLRTFGRNLILPLWPRPAVRTMLGLSAL